MLYSRDYPYSRAARAGLINDPSNPSPQPLSRKGRGASETQVGSPLPCYWGRGRGWGPLNRHFRRIQRGMERTYIMVKPDGVQRRLVGEIIRRFETRGLRLLGLKMLTPTREIAEQHYAVHRERPF